MIKYEIERRKWSGNVLCRRFIDTDGKEHITKLVCALGKENDEYLETLAGWLNQNVESNLNTKTNG